MAELRIDDLNWSLKRGCNPEATAATVGKLATEILQFTNEVRAKQASGTGSQWNSIEDFANRIEREAANLIAEAFLDPEIVKWFVQQESHIRASENYLAYLANNAERLIYLQDRLRQLSDPSAGVAPLLSEVPAPIKAAHDNGSRSSLVDIFISHSSQDASLAAQLVNLLRSALTLRADKIRCTSVDGYRLPAGADSDEQLRDEALNAVVFIGILSPLSMASAYVLFELGARWGAKKPIMPLLAPGMGPQALRGPLTGLNAISCDNAAQLHQLVSDIARIIGAEPEGAAVYQQHVDAIIYSSHPSKVVNTPTSSLLPVQALDREDVPAGVTLRAQPIQADEYADAEEIIARHCEQEWPDDYSMRAYCIEQQRDAVISLMTNPPSDIPKAVLQQIRHRCAREWPDDYSMRLYCEQQQLTGYRQVQKKRQ